MTAVRLVPLTPEHAADLHAAMQDPEVRRFTRVPQPMPEGWLAGWIDELGTGTRHGWAVLDGEGAFAGYAVTGPVDREGLEVEVGYAVVPGARGRGVATEVLRELSRWALAEGFRRVTALISTDNPASSRVAAKVGYTFEGVLRSVHHRGDERTDLESWSLLPGELRPPGAATA